jgi:hypothetical protein
MPCWRIVFSTFRGCMSFYTARVIHVIPAIPACPVRPKNGHSANARVYEYTPPSVVDLKFLRICSELRIGTSNPKTTLES